MQLDAEDDALAIPRLPDGPMVNPPAEVDRFLVRVWPDGTIYFKGPHDRVDEFVAACAEAGIQLNVDHISLCG